jgi:class 3 adenylate cyclase
VQLNDSLKTWLITLKSQLFLGGVLLTLMIILLCSLPSAEYEALRQYMKWQQKTESSLNEETLILGLDDKSTEFLKKRFHTSTLNDAFYKRLLKDLQALKIANVVMVLAPGHTYNTKWQSWKTGQLKITQGFPVSKLLEGDRYIGDERIGIYGQGELRNEDLNTKSLDSLYFPLIYAPQDYTEFTLAKQAPSPLPSMAISGLMQRFNAQSHSNTASWFESQQKTLLHEGKLIKVLPNRLTKAKELQIKADDHGRLMLRWSKNSGYFYGDVFSTRPVTDMMTLYQQYDPALRSKLKGSTVVLTNLTSVGALTQRTVLHERHLEADVVATAMDNIQQGKTLHKAPIWHTWVAMAVLFSMSFLPRLVIRKPVFPIILTLTSISVYTLLACFIPRAFNLIFPFVTPPAVAVISFIVAEYYWRIVEEKNLRNLELNMAQLVSKSVLREIKTKKTRLAAGGKRIDISSMFVDIRNFTNLSENLPPKEVTEILNTWYTQIEEIANEYRGTVDKFMGDGALIMFGAPLESTQHADMALRAGRKMIAASESLALKWKQERNIDFSIGVAVNSGYAFVGFVGPKNKLEYTAIGDTVNTAARLQDQTKVFHTCLIFSENTLKHCQNIHVGSELSSLGSIKVRGKNQQIPIYTFEDMFKEGYTQASVLAEQSMLHASEGLEAGVIEKQAPAQPLAKTSLTLSKANPFSGKFNVNQNTSIKPLKPLLPPQDS